MNTKIKNLIQDFVVMIVLIALIIVYSIKNLDWRTSEALYIGSEWINFFIAVIAKVPVYAFGMYACLCLFVIAKEKENKKARIVFMAIYALGAIICGMLGLQDFVEALISNFIDSTILTYIIAAVLACGIFYPVYLYVNKKGVSVISINKKAYLSIICSIAIVVVVSFLLKEIVDRTRYVDVLHRLGNYSKWYEKGTGGDSFPSGHVASSMLLIACFPIIKDRKFFVDKNWLYITIVFVYTICVALSRISFGAHYMTDILFAMAIAYAVSRIIYYLFFGVDGNNKEIKEGSFLEKI